MFLITKDLLLKENLLDHFSVIEATLVELLHGIDLRSEAVLD